MTRLNGLEGRLVAECVLTAILLLITTLILHPFEADGLIIQIVGYTAPMGVVVGGLMIASQEHPFYCLRVLLIPIAAMIGVTAALILAGS